MAEGLNYWQENILASTLTSIKVGGPVRFLARPTNLEQLRESWKRAQELNLPIKIMGGGSNLVFADAGLQGLVLQPKFTQLRRLSEAESEKYPEQKIELQPRYQTERDASFLHLENRTEKANGKTVLVEMDAGVSWGQAVAWTFQEQLAGLHWFARIPCQVGGAVYNNIHAEKHFLAEFIRAVRVWQPEQELEAVYSANQLEFAYDYSRFHREPAVICSVILALTAVSAQASADNQHQYLEWNQAKGKVQPTLPSVGSVFQNLERTPAAAAWYIDQCGLKGTRVGGMQVYPGHANFIVNTGGGTQRDFLDLVELIRNKVREKFQLTLQPEAECLDEQGSVLAWK